MVKVIHNKSLYLLILAGLLFPTSNVFADSNDVDFSITVNPSLTLALSSNTVNFSITPTAQGVYNSANFTVTSATNNAYGYTLVMGTNNVDLTSNTINPTTGTSPIIPTLTESQDGISAADFEASTDSTVLNHYGVAIGANNNFNAMKTTNPIKKTNTNNASGADTTTIALASKLDLNTVPGTYSTTINFQMIANPLPGGLEEAYQNAGESKKTINGKQYYAMQDMTSTICSNVIVEDDELQVYDNRDDKIYWILKARDGHCWMTQNLDHDIVDTTGFYTHENTDLGWGSSATTSWAPQYTTQPFENGRYWYNYPTMPQSADTGDWYWTDTWYESVENNYIRGNHGDKFSLTPYPNNGTHGHVGNYYNWSAAIATNITNNYSTSTYNNVSNNPQNSICPAGWRLPTASNQSASITNSTNELERLNSLYSNGANDTDMYVTGKPLWFVRGGEVYSGNFGKSGYDGFYWTSTVNSSEVAYGLWFRSSLVLPTDTNGQRSYGFSIRCVAR